MEEREEALHAEDPIFQVGSRHNPLISVESWRKALPSSDLLDRFPDSSESDVSRDPTERIPIPHYLSQSRGGTTYLQR